MGELAGSARSNFNLADIVRRISAVSHFLLGVVWAAGHMQVRGNNGLFAMLDLTAV